MAANTGTLIRTVRQQAALDKVLHDLGHSVVSPSFAQSIVREAVDSGHSAGWEDCRDYFGHTPLEAPESMTAVYHFGEMSWSPFADFAKEIHENAVAHGFWDNERNFGEMIALIHSEASEALEAYREVPVQEPAYRDADGKPEGWMVELADVIIRCLDTMHGIGNGLSIDNVIRMKMDYNAGREHRHGRKF